MYRNFMFFFPNRTTTSTTMENPTTLKHLAVELIFSNQIKMRQKAAGGAGESENTITKDIRPSIMVLTLRRSPDTSVLIKYNLRPLATPHVVHSATMVGTLTRNRKLPIIVIRNPKASKSSLLKPCMPVQLEPPVQFAILATKELYTVAKG